MIQLRRAHPALQDGSCESITGGVNENCYFTGGNWPMKKL